MQNCWLLTVLHKCDPIIHLINRCGVVEDTFWSPWPWPRGLKSSKIGLLRLENSSIFWIVKILWRAWKIFWKTFFCGDRLKNFCEDLFLYFFGDHLKNFCEDLFLYFFGDRLKSFCEDLFFFWDLLKNCREDLFFFFFFGDRLKIFSEDLFFFLESTCVCVLGSWPRAFLSLSSRVSVLGKAVLGLGLGIFLCPWPRALCPRFHLCLLTHRNIFVAE